MSGMADEFEYGQCELGNKRTTTRLHKHSCAVGTEVGNGNKPDRAMKKPDNTANSYAYDI